MITMIVSAGTICNVHDKGGGVNEQGDNDNNAKTIEMMHDDVNGVSKGGVTVMNFSSVRKRKQA